ncbi:hypothetical protein E2F43_02460 [Seongchinamella unica]|uniref:Type II secretion system protein GspC N-terminal domain-containing protein n=1 Tax=Seongchinamella unica TaxID=2547392 RepID=A0A4R5LV89_9GAMM|nr:hypothetical protein [Seongchinamella unica]TDG15118.1 hypothetical protein E2F43_02460 [Seongchinamella unica]
MNLGHRYRNLENPLRAERRVELVLIAVVLLLIVQFLWGGFRSLFPFVPDPVQPRAKSLQVIQLGISEQIDPEMRAQIAARPLFWPGRRPLEAMSEAESVAQAQADSSEEQKPGKIDGVKLTGVFGSGDAAGIIVLAKGKKRRVMVGEEVNGWELQSVEPTEALLSTGDRKASLVLRQGAIEKPQSGDEAAPAGSDGSAGEARKAKSQPGATQKKSNDTLTLGRRAPSNKT